MADMKLSELLMVELIQPRITIKQAIINTKLMGLNNHDKEYSVKSSEDKVRALISVRNGKAENAMQYIGASVSAPEFDRYPCRFYHCETSYVNNLYRDLVAAGH